MAFNREQQYGQSWGFGFEPHPQAGTGGRTPWAGKPYFVWPHVGLHPQAGTGGRTPFSLQWGKPPRPATKQGPGLKGLRKVEPDVNFRASGMDRERELTKYTHLPMGQGDALGRLGLQEMPYQGVFGDSGVPVRLADDPLAPEIAESAPAKPQAPVAARPLQEQDNKVYRPVTQWDSFEQNYRNVRNPATGGMYSGGEYNFQPSTAAPVRPAPVRPAPAPVRPAPAMPAAQPIGIPGRSVDITGLSPEQRREQMRLAEGGQLPTGDYVSPTGVTASEVLELGDKLNRTLDQNTTRGGATRLPDGRQRVNPVGLMGGGVTDEDRALTYYNRHTGRWTEPPEQMTDEQRAARFSRSAAAAGLTEGEDGLLQGTATVDPSARRRYMNYMDAGLPVSDELVEAAGGDRTALEYARMKRNERAEEMDSRQNRVEYNAAQRAMARRARMGEGVQATPRNVRAFLGDQEARRSQNLGRTGLSRVLQEEARAEAARDVAKTQAEGQLGIAGLESESKKYGFDTNVKISKNATRAQQDMAAKQLVADMYKTDKMSEVEMEKAAAATQQAQIAAESQRYVADSNSKTQIQISSQEQASRQAEIAIQEIKAETEAKLANAQIESWDRSAEPMREAAVQRAEFIRTVYSTAAAQGQVVDPAKIVADAKAMFPDPPSTGLRQPPTAAAPAPGQAQMPTGQAPAPRMGGGLNPMQQYEIDVYNANRPWWAPQGQPGVYR